MKWLHKHQFDPTNETDLLRAKIIGLETVVEDEVLRTDQAIGLLNSVYSHIEREWPTVWASLPLGLQTRVLHALGDLPEDEIVWEEGEHDES